MLGYQRSFSLEELALECGWEMDQTRDSELFKDWVTEVADQKGWKCEDDRFYLQEDGQDSVSNMRG